MNRTRPSYILLLLVALVQSARAEGTALETTVVKGVNPAENLSKFELLPKYAVADEDLDITFTSLTLKYDQAIQGTYGFNVELPLARFDSPFAEDTGICDLNLRFRQQFRAEHWTYIVGAEMVLPIATADTLGLGQYQTNLVGAAVYAVSAQTFVAGVAKQLFSVAGNSARDDIVQGHYRLLVAHSTKTGWWFLADPQLWVDYDRDARVQFSLDLEAGKMVGPLTGVWLRAGRRLGGSWQREDWSVSGGIRFISI